METNSQSICDDPKWAVIKKRYKPQGFLGKGSYGQVVRALDSKTGDLVAIKCIDFDSQNKYHLRCVKREILILRKLSTEQNNIFTNKLLDIILPENLHHQAEQMDNDMKIDLSQFNHVFLVVEC